MAALIELGAGFHPDLTGRENIYLNGSILGLKRREIDAQFSNIVEFAELEKFIDTPVKRYSSGMYVRLAFAVAAHIKADLLLIDEVLSVGDMAFQEKCMAKMSELRDSGATIIFISHNLLNVASFCKRVLLLRDGKVTAEGDPNSVIQAYKNQEREQILRKQEGSNARAGLSGSPESAVIAESRPVVIKKVKILDGRGQLSSEFNPNERMAVRCHYFASELIHEARFVIHIHRADGLLCSELISPVETKQSIHGDGIFEACIGPLFLQPDFYTIEIFIIDREFDILDGSLTDETIRIIGLKHEGEKGVIKPDVDWRNISGIE
jgi:ABC-type multidrug transport system ATPase subunit